MMGQGVLSMTVTFCGHAQISQSEKIEKWLYDVTQKLIEQGATTFYLGGYGAFDSLAASVLREQKKQYPQIELVLVLAYLNTGRNTSGYDSTVYPPLETVPRRFAISHRNRWMVESADVVRRTTLWTATKVLRTLLYIVHLPRKKSWRTNSCAIRSTLR